MLKEKSKTWNSISEQLGILFSRLPFKPNFYTWSVLPFAALGFIAFINWHILTGIILFLIAGLFDLIDGAVARHTHQTSGRGAFLDGSLDRFVDFILLFSYFWLPISLPFLSLGQWICIGFFFAIMPSFEVAYANHRQAVNDPHEKIIWRIMNRGEMYFFMLLIQFISQFNSRWAGYLFLLLIVLSAITTFQTLFNTLRLSKKTL